MTLKRGDAASQPDDTPPSNASSSSSHLAVPADPFPDDLLDLSLEPALQATSPCSFLAALRAIAERDPDGPYAIDSIVLAFISNRGADNPSRLEIRRRAVKFLEDYHVTKPSIRKILDLLTGSGAADFKALVAEVIARNPDRKVQVAAIRGQIEYCEMLAAFAEIRNDPKRLASIETSQAKDFVRQQFANAEKAKIELEGLKKTLRDRYADLLTDLSIGNAAPEIAIQAVDGKEARLSALKGKVVVLDIWATWCGPCKAMIPHERTLVERLKDKPFALVSISADEKKETLIEFLATKRCPGRTGGNGSEGGVIDDWDLRAYPTIYVLDAQGVIRHKDLRGEELEKAVNALLEEAKTRPAKAT